MCQRCNEIKREPSNHLAIVCMVLGLLLALNAAAQLREIFRPSQTPRQESQKGTERHERQMDR